MVRLLIRLAPLALIPTLVAADGCPEAPDHTAELDALIEQVQQADTERQARLISNQMWELWDDAPDEPSQEILDEGMRARAGYDYVRALDRFETLVNYCPFYAEGYNQRAFVRFLTEDFEAALPDLDRALELNPRHIGALAGRVVTLYALDRHAEALSALDEAEALNPWLSERHLRPVLEQAVDDI